MKVSSDSSPGETIPPVPMFSLPAGLIGFPDHRSFELLYVPEQLPFVWLRLHGPEVVHFVVIEPAGFIPDYDLELFDEDATQLGITGNGDTMVLNIVAVRHTEPATATVNLTGPIVVNRVTGRAKQCVLANHARYSAHHPLVVSSGN